MMYQRINVTLPIYLLKQLNSIIPAGRRSKFIAELVSEKLLKKSNLYKELEKSLDANRKFYEKEYKDWETVEAEGWPE